VNRRSPPAPRLAGWVGLALAALALVGGCSRASSPARPNVLLIESDDQRWDTLWATPEIQRRLGEGGVTFTQAVVSNPLCCPSRASLLSGGFFSHDVGVLDVSGPNGGAARFDDRDGLAVALQRQGYRTGMVGKYLNGYEALAPHVPPGWDLFLTRLGAVELAHHRLLRGGTTADAPGQGAVEERDEYLTYLERDEALAFLAAAAAGRRPFFLFLATHTPHRPSTPAPEDAESFPDYRYRDRAWGEEDLSDKPDFIRELGAGFAGEAGGARPVGIQPGFPSGLPRLQLQALQSLDRSVAAILDRLDELGLAGSTAVFFTSDNGMMWGEHRLFRKGLAYEESIRVPLLVRLPGIAPGKRDQPVAIDLDVAPTILELAGLPERAARADGASLLPLLRDGSAPWRPEVFLEGFGVPGVPPWAAVRSARYKYVEYADGQRELYDLREDPFELEDRHADPREAAAQAELARAVAAHRGLAFAQPELPLAHRGRPYEAVLTAWGGRPPYVWAVESGRLPPGLSLDSAGRIRGVPKRAVARRFLVRVTDASTSPRDGRPQVFRRFVHVPFAPDPDR
jgi:arylsulfatase A-like enzyme